MYRYLYSYIFIYIGGVEYCRIILHVLINKPRQKTSKYTVWVVHKCFPSLKLSVFPACAPCTYNHNAGQMADRPADVSPKTGQHIIRPRPAERREECASPSLKTELIQTDKLTHTCARTFTATYIHTHEPNIWLLMLNQGS